MKKLETLIGSETEYGILVSAEDEKAYGGLEGHTITCRATHAMLQEGITIAGGGICRDPHTYTSLEEHDQAEKLVRLYGDDDKDDADTPEHSELQRKLSQRRGYSGSMLVNGARFYEDMMHPEYSCAEADDPYVALCAQKAGDRIVQSAAERVQGLVSEIVGSPATISIMKNNSDGLGRSYAGHENYLVSRTLFSDLVKYSDKSHAMTMFFVVRQLLTGAGKIGSETRLPVPYQISQRADFFTDRFTSSTTCNRGIINIRDVPYADEQRYGRFHVIVGDSNRSDLSLFLKFGTTALFLMMLEDGFLARECPWYGVALLRPVYSLHTVSRDLLLTRKLTLEDRRRASALDIMQSFAECADKFVSARALPAVWQRVVTLWKGTLEGLAGDRHKHPLSRSLDWVAVERVLLHHMKKSGEGIESEKCCALELSYRTLGRDGVFSMLQERGQLTPIADEHDVERLVMRPPQTTRAYLRTEIMRRYERDIIHLKWDYIHLVNGGVLDMVDPLWSGEAVRTLFAGDPSLEEFLLRVQSASSDHIQCHPRQQRERR